MSGKSLSGGEAVFFTISPDNVLMMDMNRRLPGKHICLECKREVIGLAIGRNILAGFFGEDLIIPDDFA